MIDINVLGKGKDYIELKKSFVIFICTFDPFLGNNRKIYTFTNICHEQDGLELGDETVKIFLNTKGTVGEVDEDIDKFLAYVDGKTAEGEFTQDIAAEVERLKQRNETRVEYKNYPLPKRQDDKSLKREKNLRASRAAILWKPLFIWG